MREEEATSRSLNPVHVALDGQITVQFQGMLAASTGLLDTPYPQGLCIPSAGIDRLEESANTVGMRRVHPFNSSWQSEVIVRSGFSTLTLRRSKPQEL